MSAAETAAIHAGEKKKKKTNMVNVSEELGDIYERQRKRLDAMFQKEIEKNMPLKDTTDNVVVTTKMLELIHSIQSEKNIEDAIDSKNNRIDNIIAEFEEDEEEREA